MPATNEDREDVDFLIAAASNPAELELLRQLVAETRADARLSTDPRWRKHVLAKMDLLCEEYKKRTGRDLAR